MRPQDIPRRQERLLLADATEQLEKLFVRRFFNVERMSTFIDVLHVLRALWSATLRGQALTAEQIGHTIGMPRTTALRKLRYLIVLGHVTQEGSKYIISDKTLRTTTPILDRTIKLILETSDALRAVQNGPQKN